MDKETELFSVIGRMYMDLLGAQRLIQQLQTIINTKDIELKLANDSRGTGISTT